MKATPPLKGLMGVTELTSHVLEQLSPVTPECPKYAREGNAAANGLNGCPWDKKKCADALEQGRLNFLARIYKQAHDQAEAILASYLECSRYICE